MRDALVHRGPDEDGEHTAAEVALGVRRLSVALFTTTVAVSGVAVNPLHAGPHGAYSNAFLLLAAPLALAVVVLVAGGKAVRWSSATPAAADHQQ